MDECVPLGVTNAYHLMGHLDTLKASGQLTPELVDARNELKEQLAMPSEEVIEEVFGVLKALVEEDDD